MERQADNMKISVITPVYHGNRYLDGYMKMMSKAAWEFVEADRDNSVEVILVNDSPEIPIEFNKSLAGGFTIRILENDMNRGIHYSRVNGLNVCSGDYVVFLDHDDSISKHCFTSHRNSIGDSDVSVGNGVFEINGQRVPIFANKYSQDYAVREESYIWLRDFIVSPGQCLIKKNSIPEYWKENIIKHNGTDDYLLWLLMLQNGCSMCCNYKAIYLHRDTGANVSSDDDKMFESTEEMLGILEKNEAYPKDKLELIRRRIYYKHFDRSDRLGFMKETLKNMDIFAANVKYRALWRGCITK